MTGGVVASGGLPKRPCYFFAHGSCKNTEAECRLAHVNVSEDEKAKMQKPGSRSVSPTRAPRKPQQEAQPTAKADMHCFKFVKGKCDKGDACKFAHLTAEEVKVMKKAQKETEAKAKAKAKAQPKAKAGIVKVGAEINVE